MTQKNQIYIFFFKVDIIDFIIIFSKKKLKNFPYNLSKLIKFPPAIQILWIFFNIQKDFKVNTYIFFIFVAKIILVIWMKSEK